MKVIMRILFGNRDRSCQGHVLVAPERLGDCCPDVLTEELLEDSSHQHRTTPLPHQNIRTSVAVIAVSSSQVSITSTCSTALKLTRDYIRIPESMWLFIRRVSERFLNENKLYSINLLHSISGGTGVGRYR